MTREQIEAMTNAKVNQHLAEKVQGWTARKTENSCDWVLVITSPGKWDSVYEPSKDLNQAMEAAEKVGPVGLQLRCWSNGFGTLSWDCWWRDRPSLVSYAPTPALAVCRAVIEAHESKESHL